MRHRFHCSALFVVCMSLLVSLVLAGCGGTESPSLDTQATANPAVTTESTDHQTAAALASTETRLVPPPEAEAQIPALVTGNTAFAVELLKAARGADTASGKNLVLSPYSLSLALAMTYAGARGETETQMAEALHFALPQEQLHETFNALDRDVMASDAEKILTATSGWVFPTVLGEGAIVPIRPEYLDLLAWNYGAELYRAPGDTEEARQLINAWTAQKTEGLIPQVLPPGSLPGEWTALVLAGVMYLKAPWTYTFPAENTKPAPFYLEDGTTVEVPVMTHDMDYGYAENTVWAAVELPCLGNAGRMSRGDISAVFLLPKQGSLDEAVATTTAEDLQALLADMPREHVAVHLPRFKFESATKLKEPLKSLGVINLFKGADLSGAYEPGDSTAGDASSGVCVDEVYQGCIIGVDEGGIEAAAASMVVQVAGIGPGEITFDRPFLFLIRHVPTGTILFLGQVMNPVQESS